MTSPDALEPAEGRQRDDQRSLHRQQRRAAGVQVGRTRRARRSCRSKPGQKSRQVQHLSNGTVQLGPVPATSQPGSGRVDQPAAASRRQADHEAGRDDPPDYADAATQTTPAATHPARRHGDNTTTVRTGRSAIDHTTTDSDDDNADHGPDHHGPDADAEQHSAPDDTADTSAPVITLP